MEFLDYHVSPRWVQELHLVWPSDFPKFLLLSALILHLWRSRLWHWLGFYMGVAIASTALLISQRRGTQRRELFFFKTKPLTQAPQHWGQELVFFKPNPGPFHFHPLSPPLPFSSPHAAGPPCYSSHPLPHVHLRIIFLHAWFVSTLNHFHTFLVLGVVSCSWSQTHVDLPCLGM